MKRDERLFDELGNVDEKFINEAGNYSRKRSHKLTYILSGAAAVLVFALGAAVWNNTHTKDPVDNSEINMKDSNASENNADLPIIFCENDIGSGGMGFEGIITDNIEEIKGSNPWKEEWKLTELPVFCGNYMPSGFDINGKYTIEEMKNILSEIAESCGAELDITNVHDGKDVSQKANDYIKEHPEQSGKVDMDNYNSPSEVTAEIGIFNVKLDSTGKTEVIINTKEIPENCCPSSPDDKKISFSEAEQIINIFSEKYNDLLRMENPAPLIFRDYSFRGDPSTSYYIYDESSDYLTSLLNYSFNQVQLYTLDEKVIIRMYDRIPTDDVIGMYPIINEETAFNKLMNGDYVTTVCVDEYLPDGLKEDEVFFCGVYYRPTSDFQYRLPYYRYLIRLHHDESNIPDGLDEYGGFYVPAVKPEYISYIDTDITFN